MIPRDTVEKIIEASHVEEVVGEFVTLKKRGTNLLGLCPFHGEKTPSFTVSPTKGIYKCFGCGKAGNSVNFVMDHLQLSYPEALKWLAKKYGIEVKEREITPEEKQQQTEKESLLIVMQYAQRYFTDNMNQSDEGLSVGRGYFISRGLRDDIIERFKLGYSLNERTAFSEAAVKAAYSPEYLVKTGMSILSNRYQEGQPITLKDIFDRYSGRVMFPIHDDGGRVVAFGGRTLSTDKKVAKYINSPETSIYNKSKILYGLWQGKKSIQEHDKCYLVEGYMDVIAMHQNGIENVVASSGTSLTIDQIKAIHRFTKNVVVLYDGDSAGQKASNRAIPLLLEEGMNVKLLTFPDNDDPDSYSAKVGNDAFKRYIDENTIDFIYYKASRLKAHSNDPIERANVIRDIVENISLIPDNITRSVYVRECAQFMEMQEQTLQFEVNKIRRKKGEKAANTEFTPPAEEILPEQGEAPVTEEPILKFEAEERQLLRLMILYGFHLISTLAEDDEKNEHALDITLTEFILFELWRDQIAFENPVHQAVLDYYTHAYQHHQNPTVDSLRNAPDPLVSHFVVDQVIDKHDISGGWNKFGVQIADERLELKKAVQHLLFSYKEKLVRKFIDEHQLKLQSASSEEEINQLLDEMKGLIEMKKRVNKLLGRIVIR